MIAFLPSKALTQTRDSSYLECVYDYRYIRDTSAVMETDFHLATGEKQSVSADSLLLQIGTKASRYYTFRTFYRDSVLASGTTSVSDLINNKKMIKGESLAPTISGVDFMVYKDKVERKVITTDEFGPSAYKLTEDTPDFGWKISTGDMKEVLGFQCMKATCSFRGREYEAWFTMELPISDGPWKFCGLPGLIMEVYDIPRQYRYCIIGIRKVTREIKLPKANYIDVSLNDFLDMARKAEENIGALMSASSGPVIYLDSKGNRVSAESFIKKMKFDFQEILK